MKWITREKVKVDRVACPWLIRKFIDPQAEFLFVPADQVMEVAKREAAIPSPRKLMSDVHGQGRPALSRARLDYVPLAAERKRSKCERKSVLFHDLGSERS